MERLEYVDVFRGIAILDMIFWHLFNAFSVHSIYTDPPYYIKALNWTVFPPPLLFTFIAGISVYLLINKLQEQKAKNIAFGVVKRYGFYVLVSLPFTWFMWNLATYLGWQEAIQGIGLTAIFLSFILLAKPKNWHLFAMTFGFAGLQATLYYLTAGLTFSLPLTVVLNAFVRGWFSVTSLMPFMLAGVLVFKLIRYEKSLRKPLVLAAVFIAVGILLHLMGLKIDYFERSFAYDIFAIGLAALITVAVFYIWKKIKFNWRFFTTLGKASFAIYIGHFLLIIKPAQLLHVADTMPDWLAFLFAIAFIMVIYFAAEFYLKYKPKLKKFS
jgi:peptidoglycan/LPS O-acetylase OafA/YrhL